MYCKNCGAEIDDKAVICPKCGVATGFKEENKDESRKSRLVAFILCSFFGVLGLHRFYTGRIGSGIAMILTLGGLGIWVTIDWFVVLFGNFRDGDGKLICKWIN